MRSQNDDIGFDDSAPLDTIADPDLVKVDEQIFYMKFMLGLKGISLLGVDLSESDKQQLIQLSLRNLQDMTGQYDLSSYEQWED